MSTVNIVFFNVGHYVPFLDELERFYENSSKYDVERIQNAPEVVQFLSASQSGILLFKITGKKDLQDAVGVLKSLKKLIKQGAIKPACFSTIKNKKVETVLAKYGCIDILEPNTKAKTMSFKMDFWSKPIIAHLDKIKKEEELQSKKNEQAKKTAANVKKDDFSLVKPLELQSDIWLVKHKNDYKKILRRYLVRLLGPSPFIGNWVELEPKPGDKQQTWKYVLKNPENKDYIIDDGAWFFYGSKPEFDWKIQRWNFPSEFPHLYFYSRDGQTYSKFKFEGDHVDLAENSEFAKMREEMILETCNSEFNIEGDGSEKDSSENLDGEAQSDDLGGNLEGKGTEADNVGGDPLSGKGSAADRLGDDPLSGKGSAADRLGDDPLSGKAGAADQLNNLDNDGKKSFAEVEKEREEKRSKTDHLEQNPLSGKGSAADSFGDDPLSGKAGAADQLNNLDNDGKKSFAEVEKEREEKRSKTDQLEQNPLSGKGSAADSFGDDPLSGKAGAADQLNNLDNDGKKSFAEVEKEREEKRSKTDHLEQNPLSGKGSAADSFGDDPLSGKAGAADQLKDHNNKSATDQLDQNPLSGRASNEKLKSDPLSGPSQSADKLNDLDSKNRKQNKDNESQKNQANASLFEELEKQGIDPQDLPVLPDGSLDENHESLADVLSELRKQGVDPSDIDLPAKIDPDLAAIMDELSKHGINPEELGYKDDGSIDTTDKKLNDILDDLKNKGVDISKLAIDEEGNLPILAAIDSKKKSLASGYNPSEETKKALDQEDDGENHYLEAKKKKEAARAAAEGLTEEYLADHKKNKELERQANSERDERERSLKDALNEQRPDGLGAEEKTNSNSNIVALSGKDIYSDAEKKKDHAPGSMEDVLGGDLTKGSQINLAEVIIDGKAQPDNNKPAPGFVVGNEAGVDKPELAAILNEPNELNLESGELKVIIKQQTAAGNSITFLCEFEDFYEDELIAISPKNSLKEGTQVSAEVTLIYNNKKVKVDCKGSIEEVEEFSESKDTLAISITEIDSQKYETFIALYRDRQSSINDFMEKAKGY